MRITTKRKRWGGATIKPKVLRRAMKRSLMKLGQEWFTMRLKRHFFVGAAEEYDYAARKPETLRRKRAHGLKPIPLVTKHGRLQKLSTRQATISGSANRARVTFNVPPRTSQQYREEITRVSRKDQEWMVKRLDADMQARIDRHKDTLERKVLS